MHICFVDESGTPAKPGKESPRFFVFAGVIIPEDQWGVAREKLLGLKRRMKYRGEVKWRFFAPRNNDASNPMLDWDQERRNEFRSDFFSIISSIKSIKIVAGVSDAPLAYSLGNVNSQEDIYFRTYKVVTERFQYLLQDISRESGRKTHGMVVSDHRNGHEDNKMREQHERLVREGRVYTSTYENFIESIFFAPSHMSIGIQFADMAAGAIWRYYEHQDDYWLNAIRSSFRKSGTGLIDGFGIARFPKQGWTGPVVA